MHCSDLNNKDEHMTPNIQKSVFPCFLSQFFTQIRCCTFIRQRKHILLTLGVLNGIVLILILLKCFLFII